MMFKDQWQVLTRFPNGNELSTVKLPEMFYKDRWESCMFYAEGSSNVISVYNCVEEAIRGHAFLVAHELMHDVAKIQHK